MKSHPFIARFLFLAVGASSLPVSAASLQESVLAALQDSAAVEQAISRARAASEEIKIARSRMRPNVQFEAAAGPAYRDRSIDGVSAGTGDALFSRRASVSVSQLLFDWGATGRFSASARLRQMYEELLIADVREEQALLTAETYVGVLAAKLKANLIVEKVEYLSTLEKLSVGRQKNDGDTQAAILQGRLGSAQADLEKALGQVEALERRYELLTNLKPMGMSMPSLPDVGGVYSDIEAAPQVAAARNAAQAQAMQVEALKKDLRPTLGLELRAGAGESVLGIDGPDNELSALAVVRWNPFDGGRKRAVIRQAEAGLAEDRAVINDIKLAINDRVSTAQSEFKAAGRRQAELRRSIRDMSSAVTKFDGLLANDQQGATPLSVAAIYGERNSAQADLVESWVESYRAAFRVLASAGQLVDYLGVNPGPTAAVSGMPVSQQSK